MHNTKDLEVVYRQCAYCQETFELFVGVEDVIRYLDGESAGHCFPYLTPGQRELYVVGVCEDCWDSSPFSDKNSD